MSCQNCQKLNWNCGIILQVMVGGGGGDYNFSSLGQGEGRHFSYLLPGRVIYFHNF